MMGSFLATMLLLQASPDAANVSEPVEEAVVEEAAAEEVARPVVDDVICRRKFSAGNKFGERTSSTKVCKTREQWEADRRKRR